MSKPFQVCCCLGLTGCGAQQIIHRIKTLVAKPVTSHWIAGLKTGNISALLSNNCRPNPLLLLNISPMKRRVSA
jgi:hypothetical protein